MGCESPEKQVDLLVRPDGRRIALHHVSHPDSAEWIHDVLPHDVIPAPCNLVMSPMSQTSA